MFMLGESTLIGPRARPPQSRSESQRSEEPESSRLLTCHFSAQHRRPGDLGEIDPTLISPYHRVLLVTDGTVTSLIEAHALEALVVQPVDQRHVPVVEDQCGWRGISPGAVVIRRRVVIRGRHSNRVHAYAQSLLDPSRLPPDFLPLMGQSRKGLGTALARSRWGSRRELLGFGTAETPAWARDYVPAGSHLSRTYRLRFAAEPAV